MQPLLLYLSSVSPQSVDIALENFKGIPTDTDETVYNLAINEKGYHALIDEKRGKLSVMAILRNYDS